MSNWHFRIDFSGSNILAKDSNKILGPMMFCLALGGFLPVKFHDPLDWQGGFGAHRKHVWEWLKTFSIDPDTKSVHFSGEGSNFGATPLLTQSRMMQIPNNDDVLL